MALLSKFALEHRKPQATTLPKIQTTSTHSVSSHTRVILFLKNIRRYSIAAFKKSIFCRLSAINKHRPNLSGILCICCALLLIAGLLLPAAQVRAAATLTWSDNADFSFNKTSLCKATQLESISLSSSAYTDPTCSAMAADSNLKLSAAMYSFGPTKSISAGDDFSLALKEDGTVWAWGNNTSGQLGDNTTTQRTLPIQVQGPGGSGFLTGIEAISAGASHSLALKDDGTVWSWGSNTSGQLGDNTTTQRTTPVQVKGLGSSGFLTGVTAISAGSNFTLAMKDDGTVWGWGDNIYGTLGDSTQTQRTTPVEVRGIGGSGFLAGIKAISAGFQHSLALKDDGTVWGWGSNSYGSLSDYGTYTWTTPVQVKGAGGSGFLTNIKAIDAGNGYSLALSKSGTVWGWGMNNNGQLGNGSTQLTSVLPTQVKDPTGSAYLTNITTISAGTRWSNGFSLALKDDGTVWGWGDNSGGPLGNNTQTSSLLPIQVKDETGLSFLTDVAAISAGNAHTLAIKKDGTVWAWGNNTYGQAGYSFYTQNALTPHAIITAVDAGSVANIKKISAGSAHSIALKEDGTVWAWGDNSMGQLGIGTLKQQTSPIQVQVKDSTGSGFLTGITAISAGRDFTLALKDDGTVWAWGINSQGELGIGNTNQSPLPVQVKDSAGSGFLTGVTGVSAGNGLYTAPGHSLAVKADGTVWGWGYNPYGQLGDGTKTSQNKPVQVQDPTGSGFLTGVTGVSAGNTHSLAVKGDGTVWAWGRNSSGQLGDNTTTEHLRPNQVKDQAGSGFLTGITAISASSSTYALKDDGTVWGWGDNYSGELGIGNTTGQLLPVQVQGLGGSGFLTGITAISAGNNFTLALKDDGTLWGWGNNYYGNLGDNTTTQRTTPVQAVGNGGSGFLNDATDVSVGEGNSLAVTSSKTALGWGNNDKGQLGYTPGNNNVAPQSSRVPLPVSYLNYYSGYASRGSLGGIVVDAGVNKRSKWYGVSWKTDALPTNTSVTFNARTSDDGVTWSDWSTAMTQSTAGSVDSTGILDSLVFSRFLELKVTLQSSDHVATPTLNEFSLNYLNDTTTPETNASGIVMSKSEGGNAQAENSWVNTSPYFAWSAGGDGADGSGIQGYCAYLGHDQSASVTQTKGSLGNSPLDSNGSCPYVVPSNELDLSGSGVLGTALTSSDEPYYLLLKAIDNAGNVYTGSPAAFTFRYDNTPPTNPAFISAPAQFIATKNVTLTWPTSGGQEANDATSGLAGLQYRIGLNGKWYGDAHNGNQDTTDMLANDGSYTFDPTVDYPLLSDGNNIVYFRTIDNAGNVSVSYNTAAIKISTTSPTPIQSLSASPTTNTLNVFSFTWQPPQTYVGSASGLTYCYTVNTLPSTNTCSFTTQTSLPSDAYATQPGSNTLYVVAKDEAGNMNYDTYATVTFTANTPAPGISGNFDIADISTKVTRAWKLALSWSQPEDTGSGVARYAIYRSTNGTTFAQIATTSGLSYVDSSLSQLTYYYKIKACDSANNCGAFSQVASRMPTGRFVVPPELVTNPSVEASTRTASFHWTTDRDSDSRIQYGIKSGTYFPGEITVGTRAKSHTVDLLNLDAGTTYYYKVKWTDEDGNTGSSGEFMFTTAPAPSVKNVTVLNKTLDSTTIQFTSTDAAKVSIYYGKNEGFGGVKSINTSHYESTYTIILTGLSDGTTYSYKLSTFDESGNEYDSRRIDTFTTPARPLITNLRFQPVAGAPTSTQKVTWTTNVLASTTITYGKVSTAGSDLYNSKLTTEHEIVLQNLEDDSQYFLVARSRDAAGNLATSDQQVFKTSLDSRPPLITDQRVESSVKGSGSEARGQIVVSWKTDEPATSQVAYANGGRGGTYTSRTAEDTQLTTEHVVIISNLSTSAVYHIQPISQDKAENGAQGTDQSVIIGRPTDNVLTIILNALNKIFGT